MVYAQILGQLIDQCIVINSVDPEFVNLFKGDYDAIVRVDDRVCEDNAEQAVGIGHFAILSGDAWLFYVNDPEA